MKNMNLMRGLFLIAIALLFGLTSLNYSIGKLGKAGPGMFPLIVSSMLLMIGIVTVIKSRFETPVVLSYNVKNIAIVLFSLTGFALISQHLNMIVGIFFLVFTTAFAAESYTVIRNIKISICLIAIGYAFKYLLSLNLPLP
jgi:hypothetical protein